MKKYISPRIAFAFILFFLSVAFIMHLLFPKKKDYYIIKQIRTRLVTYSNKMPDYQFSGHVDVRKIPDEGLLGISLIVHQELVSGSDSEREFISSPGFLNTRGTLDSLDIDIYIISNNQDTIRIGSEIFPLDINFVDTNTLSLFQHHFYKYRPSLKSFVQDINSSAVYTTKPSFHLKNEFYFVFSDKVYSNRMLLNTPFLSTIYVDVKTRAKKLQRVETLYLN